jgi:hypothetical protein
VVGITAIQQVITGKEFACLFSNLMTFRPETIIVILLLAAFLADFPGSLDPGSRFPGLSRKTEEMTAISLTSGSDRDLNCIQNSGFDPATPAFLPPNSVRPLTLPNINIFMHYANSMEQSRS